MAQRKETLESSKFSLHQEDQGTFRGKKFKIGHSAVDVHKLQTNQWKIFGTWGELDIESEKAKFKS